MRTDPAVKTPPLKAASYAKKELSSVEEVFQMLTSGAPSGPAAATISSNPS